MYTQCCQSARTGQSPRLGPQNAPRFDFTPYSTHIALRRINHRTQLCFQRIAGTMLEIVPITVPPPCPNVEEETTYTPSTLPDYRSTMLRETRISSRKSAGRIRWPWNLECKIARGVHLASSDARREDPYIGSSIITSTGWCPAANKSTHFTRGPCRASLVSMLTV